MGRQDTPLDVCKWCEQDLTLFGVRINQVVRLPKQRLVRGNMLRFVLGPVYSMLEVKL